MPPGQSVFGIEFRCRRIGDGLVGKVWGILNADRSLWFHLNWHSLCDSVRLSQRLDPRHARALDVYDQFKLVFFLFRQLTVCVGDGLAETHRLSLSRESCFEDQHLLQLQALSHRCDVIDHRGRKLFVPKPHTDKCVTTGEYQQRVEVSLL